MLLPNTQPNSGITKFLAVFTFYVWEIICCTSKCYLIGISMTRFWLWGSLNFWIHTLACWCKTMSCVLSSAFCFFPKIGYIMVKKNNFNLFYLLLWLNLFEQSHLFSCTVKPLGFWHTLKKFFLSKQYRNGFMNSYFKIAI